MDFHAVQLFLAYLQRAVWVADNGLLHIDEAFRQAEHYSGVHLVVGDRPALMKEAGLTTFADPADQVYYLPAGTPLRNLINAKLMFKATK